MDSAFNIKFNEISERDMDMLFIEEIISSKKFLDIFISKIGIKSADVINAEISKTDLEFGESDITIILSVENRKHAILIEDKIDAIAMTQQCERYFKRGEHGILNGEYDAFDVFIIAPQKYLSQNVEASKYPYKVTYEECANYFSECNNSRGKFKFYQISQAIDKQKHGYQVVENKPVTAFWDNYITYKEENYPELWLVSKRGSKGINARWPQYNTVINNICIYHKSEMGYVDLTIKDAAKKIVVFEQLLNESLNILTDCGLLLVKTGKSAAIRINVPILDFTKPFSNYINEIPICFEAIKKLTDFAKKLSENEKIIEFIVGNQ